jgi:hypothetical protein
VSVVRRGPDARSVTRLAAMAAGPDARQPQATLVQRLGPGTQATTRTRDSSNESDPGLKQRLGPGTQVDGLRGGLGLSGQKRPVCDSDLMRKTGT